MKIFNIVFIICIFVTEGLLGQDYDSLLRQAKSLMSASKYEQSAAKWDSLKGLGLPHDEQYLGVQCWALAGQTDKAIKSLLATAKHTYYLSYDEVKTNNNLNPLHTDKRWDRLLKILKKRSKNFDIPLMTMLQSIHDADQVVRNSIDSIGNIFGWDSPEIKQAYQKMHLIDSGNARIVTLIIDSAGWLGRDVIGDIGSTTFFLVIQHSNLATKKKYLPYLKEAHRKKWKVRFYDIGYLEDRIAQIEGRPQIYGTQLTRVDGKLQFYPIEDVRNVNKRRKSLSMGPIEEYAKFNNISFRYDK